MSPRPSTVRAFAGPLVTGVWNAATNSFDFGSSAVLVFSTNADLNSFIIADSTDAALATNLFYFVNGSSNPDAQGTKDVFAGNITVSAPSITTPSTASVPGR